jgi:hypothetical protein
MIKRKKVVTHKQSSEAVTSASPKKHIAAALVAKVKSISKTPHREAVSLVKRKPLIMVAIAAGMGLLTGIFWKLKSK